jgi:hypothetical protein
MESKKQDPLLQVTVRHLLQDWHRWCTRSSPNKGPALFASARPSYSPVLPTAIPTHTCGRGVIDGDSTCWGSRSAAAQHLFTAAVTACAMTCASLQRKMNPALTHPACFADLPCRCRQTIWDVVPAKICEMRSVDGTKQFSSHGNGLRPAAT